VNFQTGSRSRKFYDRRAFRIRIKCWLINSHGITSINPALARKQGAAFFPGHEVPITFRLCRDYLRAPYSLGSRESSIFDAYSLSVIDDGQRNFRFSWSGPSAGLKRSSVPTGILGMHT